MPMLRSLSFLLAPLLVAAPVAAQQPPPAGCTAPEYRQFDFWEGDWEVTDSAGTVVMGTNLITREESGCVLREQWRAGRGGTGQSLNFYERLTGRWAQVWVASNGSVLRLQGGFENGAMRLEGETRPPNGPLIRNRIVWTPLADGRVRQSWLTSRDSGATWQAGFDGWYRRRRA